MDGREMAGRRKVLGTPSWKEVSTSPSPGPRLTPNPDVPPPPSTAHAGHDPKSLELLERSLEAIQVDCPTPRAAGRLGHGSLPRRGRHTRYKTSRKQKCQDGELAALKQRPPWGPRAQKLDGPASDRRWGRRRDRRARPGPSAPDTRLQPLAHSLCTLGISPSASWRRP